MNVINFKGNYDSFKIIIIINQNNNLIISNYYLIMAKIGEYSQLILYLIHGF